MSYRCQPADVRQAITVLKSTRDDLPDDVQEAVDELLEEYKSERARGRPVDWEGFGEWIVEICEEAGMEPPLPELEDEA